jgi:hypothetical protein
MFSVNPLKQKRPLFPEWAGSEIFGNLYANATRRSLARAPKSEAERDVISEEHE